MRRRAGEKAARTHPVLLDSSASIHAKIRERATRGTSAIASVYGTHLARSIRMSSEDLVSVKKSGNGRGRVGPGSAPFRELPHALQAVKEGDFSVRLPSDRLGLEGKLADTFNDIVAANARMAEDLTRVGPAVGKQGKTRQRGRFGRQRGAWGQMEGAVNTLIDDLLWPTTEVTRAIAAV